VLGLGEMCLHFVVIASSLESSSYDVGMTEYMVSLLKGVSVLVFSKRTSKAVLLLSPNWKKPNLTHQSSSTMNGGSRKLFT
jgi:hypothetical protein